MYVYIYVCCQFHCEMHFSLWIMIKKLEKHETDQMLQSFAFLPSFLFFLLFLGPHSWHTKVPRLGANSELQLPAYTTATAIWDPSHICDLHHSSQQYWTPNPLSKARDRTRILMNTSQICFCCATMGTPPDPNLVIL